MNITELTEKRELIIRNLQAGEGITFANGPFAEYEQERIARRMDLQQRLREIEQRIAKETQQ